MIRNSKKSVRGFAEKIFNGVGAVKAERVSGAT